MARLITCKYCNKIHDINFKCGNKKKYYREKYNNKNYKKTDVYNKIIKSSKWRKLSEHVKTLDNYSCLVCLDCGINQPQYLEVHHILKVNENIEESYNINNLITLCVYHHKQADNEQIEVDELYYLIDKYRKEIDFV